MRPAQAGRIVVFPHPRSGLPAPGPDQDALLAGRSLAEPWLDAWLCGLLPE
jgi:hypothetical protein